MKRYTLRIQPIDASINPDELKDEVEQVLLRLHPRITYKMGQVLRGVDGKLQVEMAMDGKRQLLEETFNSRTWKVPVRFERLSWGWMLENEDAQLLISSATPIENDPLADIAPLEGTGEVVLSKRLLRGRYIALMISTMLLILVFIANAIHPRSTLWEAIYIVLFAIFLFTLNETPLDIRVYAQKIAFKSLGLEVSYWLLSKSAFLEWRQVWGLDYTSPVCVVLSSNGKLRFLLSEGFGCKDRSVVLKTIVNRAGLSFVEGNFQYLMYRKPDAKDNHPVKNTGQVSI